MKTKVIVQSTVMLWPKLIIDFSYIHDSYCNVCVQFSDNIGMKPVVLRSIMLTHFHHVLKFCHLPTLFSAEFTKLHSSLYRK